MHYKHLIFFLLLLSASLTHANVYVVAGGGVTDGTFKYERSDTPQVAYEGEINGMAQVGIGLAKHFQLFFAGIEAGAEWQGFDVVNSTTLTEISTGETFTATTITHLKNDYYIHGKAGYIVRHDFVIYGLLGALWGDFTIQDPAGDSGFSGESEHLMKSGFRAGLGISNRVYRQFEWRVEYTVNRYGSIQSSVIDPDTGDEDHYSRRGVAINQVLLGLGYYF